MAKAKTPRLTAEIGRAGLQQWSGVVQEEFDVDLRGLRGVKFYDEMRRNDPTIAAGMRAITWILGQVNWTAEPGGETPADQEAATFLGSCLEDMSLAWSKAMRDILTMLVFGWAYLEITYKIRNGPEADPDSRYDDGRIGWRKLTLLGQDTLSHWQFDDKGGVQGMYQTQLSGPAVLILIEKALLCRLDDEKNNPEGISLLRPVANSYYMKKQLQEIEAIGIERDLTGVLIINLPIGATETDMGKARDLVEQYKADDMAGFIAPQFGAGEHERWRFEVIASPGSKGIDPDKVIRRYDYAIARSFLAQFLMLGQADAGSWALARDQRDMFEIALGAILKTVQETLNRFLVPVLFRLNSFGKLTGIPQLVPGRISKGDLEKFAVALQTLASAGLLTADRDLEAYIRQEMDLPELPEDEATPGETEDTGQGEGATPETPTPPDEEQTGQGESKAQSEPEEFDEEPALPDPDDEDAWAQLEKEAQKWLS